MVHKLDPSLKKIHRSITFDPSLIKAVEEFRHDPKHQLVREDGYTEMPTFNTVVEIGTRILLKVKPEKEWPKSPDEV
jgi:hypothetical protein